MELKRGWWKQENGEYSFLAGEHDGRWYGVGGSKNVISVETDGTVLIRGVCHQASDDLTDTYCGDGPEPVEPVAQPDPRDAEIERLKAENEKLLNAIDSQSSEINRLLTKCHRLDVKLATIKSEYNNLARIIGDH